MSNDTDKNLMRGCWKRRNPQFKWEKWITVLFNSFSIQSSRWRYVVLVSQEIVKVNNIFKTLFNHRYRKICHFTVSFIIPTLISISNGHAVVSLVLSGFIKSINKQTNEKGFYEARIWPVSYLKRKFFWLRDEFCQSNVNFSEPFGISWMGRDYSVAK